MQWLRTGWALICAVILIGVACVACAEENAAAAGQFVYGQSELGRDLVCHRVGSETAEKSLLMVFGVHGFEDAFDHDGEVLRLIAHNLIAYYTEKPEELGDFCLYIIPSANPDGLLEGTTQHGFGRCNANGIDINRDFSSDWSKETRSRNRTGKAPFATAKARAIRDLVLNVRPDYAMDIHGWVDSASGNGKMAQTFAAPFKQEVNHLVGGGMVSAWLNTVTKESMLLELPENPDTGDYVKRCTNGLIEGIKGWIEKCSR